MQIVRWREWTGEASWRSAGDGESSSPALSRTGAVIRPRLIWSLLKLKVDKFNGEGSPPQPLDPEFRVPIHGEGPGRQTSTTRICILRA